MSLPESLFARAQQLIIGGANLSILTLSKDFQPLIFAN